MDINDDQRYAPIRKLNALLSEDLEGKTIGVLGLSFKPNTDDMREAPSIDIIRHLISKGAQVRAFDPVAMHNAEPILPEVEMMDDSYALAEDSDALILVTEWNEFKNLDLARIKKLMKQPVLIDGRNVYDPAAVRDLGFRYLGIGRGYDNQGLG